MGTLCEQLGMEYGYQQQSQQQHGGRSSGKQQKSSMVQHWGKPSPVQGSSSSASSHRVPMSPHPGNKGLGRWRLQVGFLFPFVFVVPTIHESLEKTFCGAVFQDALESLLQSRATVPGEVDLHNLVNLPGWKLGGAGCFLSLLVSGGEAEAEVGVERGVRWHHSVSTSPIPHVLDHACTCLCCGCGCRIPGIRHGPESRVGDPLHLVCGLPYAPSHPHRQSGEQQNSQCGCCGQWAPWCVLPVWCDLPAPPYSFSSRDTGDFSSCIRGRGCVQIPVEAPSPS